MKQKTENRGGKRQGAGRKASPNKMVMTSLRLPIEVKNGLTTKEKRVVLATAHEEKMRDLDEWCAKMLNKLNSK